ncbi:MAG: heavy-metal-associated domain-containing protein [Boseongicola sp.]|nr:heavy-metal-associated domain-containing protein [Boseongicola sp.]
MKFHVPDMSCAHCTAAITDKITALDPDANVTTELDGHTVEVVTTSSEASVVDAIKAAGYEATPI